MATFQYLDEGNSEAQDRLATSFLLAQTSPGLATTGVLSGLAVTQTTTASGSVLIAAGAAVVQASVGTGVALLVNDTQATLDVFTTDPMGALPRNDVVAFDSVTKTIIAIIGTPNATPDDPTVPDTACPLARLRHAASATTIPTAKIDQLGVATRLSGVRAPAVVAQFGAVASTGALVRLGSAPAAVGDGVSVFKITVTIAAAYSTVSGDTATLAVVRTNNSVIWSAIAIPLTSTWGAGRTLVVYDTPAAGSMTYSGGWQRAAGSGSCEVQGSQIIVEQIA